MSVPLAAHGRVVGAANLVDGEFTAENMALLTSIGKQVGLGIENAELAREVARKERARSELLKKAIAAQEDERRRIARELHDDTGQSLTAVIMALGAISAGMGRVPRKLATMVDDARNVSVQALENTRHMIVGLRPPALDDLGLVPAVRRFAEEVSRAGSTEITIEAGGLPRKLAGDSDVVMFRILQEGLHNVVRHSGARHAWVRLNADAAGMNAEIEDDGSGFDLEDAMAHPETGRGLGIMGMSERASLLGGTVSVESESGRGTRLRVRIPLVTTAEKGEEDAGINS